MDVTIQKQDETGIRLQTEQCNIAKTQLEWLGYKLSADGKKLIEKKFQAITDRLRPKKLKDLKS